MSHTRLIILLIVCILLTACAGQPASPPASQPTAAPLAVNTVKPSATLPPTPSPSPVPPTKTPAATNTPLPPTETATPTAPQLASRYRFNVQFDYDQKSAEIEEQIDYTNPSGDTLSELRLVIPPLAYTGSFNLKSIQWSDGQAVQNPTYSSSWMNIPLTTPLAPGQNVSLQIQYHLVLPSAAAVAGSRPVPIGYSTRQANLVDWYPFVPPYRSDSGWIAHPFSAYGESMVYEYSSFDVTLTLSGGKNLVVAASAPAEQDGQTYHYTLDGARCFAISISPDYVTTSQTVDGVEVTAYTFPTHPKAGKDAPIIVGNAISLFGERFAPYPHKSLAVVEADFLDGMEYDGLIFISKGMYNLYNGEPDGYFTAIVTHETAHQWWFALVGNDQAEEPWLDEALATYSEVLYYQKFAPAAVKWWWDIRVNYYHPSGAVNSSVYDQQGHADSYTQYRNAVYLNGAIFLYEIHRTVGDEVFFAFLKDYAGRYSQKIATGKDFFEVFASHSQMDLAPLLKRFFK